MLYVDPNSIRRLTTERSEARRREAWAEAKILCLRAVISFLFFVIAYRFYNKLIIKIQENSRSYFAPLYVIMKIS
jgi:hypothetical protein